MPTEQTPNIFSLLFPFALVFLIFQFLVFRPEKEKRRKFKEMMDTLKKNDKVVTTGGIHGTVVLVKDKTVVVRVDENVRIEFDKEALTGVEKETN